MSTFIIIGLFIVMVGALTVVYVLLRKREQRLVAELEKAKEEASNGAFLNDRLQEIQTRALQQEQEILAQAQKEATEVVAQAHGAAAEAQTKAELEAQQEVEQTRQQAEAALAQAQTQAAEVVAAAEAQAKQLVEQTATKLQEMESQFQQKETEQLAPVYDQAAKDVTTATGTLSNKTEELFMTLQTEMMNQLKQRQEGLDAKMEGEWQQAREEIATFKEERKKQIEAKQQEAEQQLESRILGLLSDTLRQTIGVTLTPKDHQKLVFEALEKAKEDHVFDEQQPAQM